ncbi:MAG TPA: glycosyltransferase [Chloroflexia bacterium]|nr:glycosyltransferase [Chloroflexia bacterium]
MLQLIDHLGNGGAERLQVTFAAGIDRARFDLHVCALRTAPGLSITPELRALGVPVTELEQRNAYDIPALMSLVSYIRRNRIDIIHTHLLASDIMGRMAGFLTGRPVVSTIHNSREDLDAEPPRRQWLERWTARLMARRLIVVSALLREEIASWFGVPLKRVVTIPNGVDIERFHRGADFDRVSVRRELLGGDYPMVINVARWTPQKDQRTLIEAARIVAEARPDVRFVLVGHGPLHDDLVAQAAEAGISDKVIFAGFREDVADVLAAGDLFVLSSLWEGMPLALLEAMAAGCATVSTNVGGVAQVLQDKITGLLVPPADPPALASAILRYVNEPQLKRQHGEAGYLWVKEHYSMQAWVGKLEELYRRELRR